MNGIKELRLQLGLSQEKLAEYLGIPRSSLSMSEAGQRCLPVKALQMLALLQQSLQSTDHKNNQRLAASISTTAPVEIQAALRNKNHELELEYLRNRLYAMASRYKELESNHITAQRMLIITYENPEENRFWEDQKRNIYIKMKACNPEKQNLLLLRIQQMEKTNL